MKMRRWAAIACAALAIASATACAPVKTQTTGAMREGDPIPAAKKVQAAADKLPEKFKQAGKLRIVMSDGTAPLNVPDTATGEVEGFNPDLARQVGAVLGVKVEITGVPIDQIIPGIEAGRYDAVFSNFSITDARLKVLDFAEYYFSASGLGVQAGNPQGIDLDHMCGRRIGVSNGSFQMTDTLPEYSQSCADKGEPKIDIAAFPDQQKAALALLSGRVDATVTDGPVLAYASSKEPRIERAGEVKGSNVGVGAPKGDGLIEALSAALQELIDNGTYERILKSYGMDHLAVKEAKVVK